MDVPGAVQQITLLKRDIAQCRDDVQQVVALLGLVCEVIARHDQALRNAMADRVLEELIDERTRPDRRAIRARVYSDGLEFIKARLEKIPS